MLSYFSSKASSVFVLPLPHLSFTAFNPRLYQSKSRFCPSFPLKFSRLSFACHVDSGRVPMDSPLPDVSVSIDSVAQDLQNQSLQSNASESVDLSNGTKKVRLKLEDLHWDHSFVRELPGDPRTDSMPREVCLFYYFFLSCYSFKYFSRLVLCLDA